MQSIKSLCVYCGSSPGRNPLYLQAAQDLAAVLVERGIRLIYGGAGIGIMGALADRVLELGGEVVGVIPKALAHKEVMHQRLTKLQITHSMHERKRLMAELADGFIALPGGIGTLEELFEIWTWAQLGFHAKPCGLLNVAEFYTPLLSFLDHVTAEQFVQLRHRQILLVANDVSSLLNEFDGYVSPAASIHLVADQL